MRPETRRSPWTQAATLAVTFSFLVQSLGAADLAMMMRQPAAVFMPPPSSAARLAALHKPVASVPAAKEAPKGPSLWSRVGARARPAGRRLLALAQTAGLKASAAWDELMAPPEPAAIAPVDLAAAAVIKEEPIPEPKPQPVPAPAPAVAAAQDRMLISAEALAEPVAVPQPEPVAETAPAPREMVETAPQPINDRRNLFRYPRLRPTAWISSFNGRAPRGRGEAQNRSVMPRLDGRWIDGRGLRYRVNYLNPRGFSRASGQGVEYIQPGRRMLNRGEVLPQRLWDTYAIYAHGDTVDYEVEVENTSDQVLRDVAVVSSEEVLNRAGGAGDALGPARVLRLQGGLAPGRKTVLRDSFPITINWVFQGSFEQTHVQVSAKSGTEPRATLRGEACQAGVIDPPPED